MNNSSQNLQRALCFDMDGVIIHTMPLHAKAWLQAVKKFDLSVSRREIYQWEGEPGTITAHRLLNRSNKPQRLAQALLRYKEGCFMKLSRRVRISPGWAAIIKRLKLSNIRMALVTGTSRRELHKMLPIHFIRHFHTITTGDQVARGKPHPEPFLTALSHLGIPPRMAIVVENAPYGIQSAKSARVKIVAALTSSLSAKYLYRADLIFSSSFALQRWLLTKLG